MKRKYIIPKTQVKAVSTEIVMAGSPTLRVDNTSDAITSPTDAGWAKKGFGIWDEEDQ